MKSKLKAIIYEFGRNALDHPDDLAVTMRERGIPEKDVLTVQMILKCCPTVSAVLNSDLVTEAEVNVLIRAAVQKTGLSAASVRYAMGVLVHACGHDAPWTPHLISREKKLDHQLMPATVEEGETMDELRERMEDDPDSAAVLSDLNTLAEQGNVTANYKLGQHYKLIDEVYDTETALPYFQRAAELGYGPAHGAVANYLLRREQKDMEKIADLFRSPTALSGSDGREWNQISAMVLEYQQENKVRQRTALISQLIFLALILAAITIGGINGAAPVFLRTISVVLQVASIGWTVFIMGFKPLATVKYAYYTMTLSCLLLILGMF